MSQTDPPLQRLTWRAAKKNCAAHIQLFIINLFLFLFLFIFWGGHRTEKDKGSLLQKSSKPPNAGVFNSRTHPHAPPTHRAPTETSILFHVLTRAQRARTDICPENWLLCRLDL
jgi:hypothetical protein